jgi:hypothetical protein
MLFCLDFDQTIVKGHFHNALMKSGGRPGNHESNIEMIEQLLDNPEYGLKNGAAMKQFIQTALGNGHKVAVTTYSLFPEVCTPTFLRMGLSTDEIAQIPCVAFLPKDQSQGKTQHIQQAMQLTGITDKSSVVLVDDSENNCQVAHTSGCLFVKVPESKDAKPDYICTAVSLASQIK